MAGSFNSRGELEISDGLIISCFGKKRSGKSLMGRLLAFSYPRDVLVIAANHDDGPFPDPDRGIHEIDADAESMPRRWPEHLREDKERMTLRIQVDAGSPTFLEDQDAAVGLALRHGNCAVLVHEVGLLAPSNRVPPHMRRLLHANRHRGVTAILCGPRPLTVDALVLAQSDVVYAFEMQVPQDRKRLAETVGWDPRDMDEAIEGLGPHEYLRYDANMPKPEDGEEDLRLVHFPALPLDVVNHIP
jgi:hypothetical protein